MNKNTIFIDTSSNKRISVGLEVNGEKDLVEEIIGDQKAQVVLPLIADLLTKHKLKPTDVTNIEVVVGPGSFTGLRVGVSIANALAYSLKIPVNGKPIGQFVTPIYE